MLNYESQLTDDERSMVQHLINNMGIENKPTINEFLNDVRKIAAKHGLIKDEAEQCVGGVNPYGH